MWWTGNHSRNISQLLSRWSQIPLPLNAGWSLDVLWSVEGCRSGVTPVMGLTRRILGASTPTLWHFESSEKDAQPTCWRDPMEKWNSRTAQHTGAIPVKQPEMWAKPSWLSSLLPMTVRAVSDLRWDEKNRTAEACVAESCVKKSLP